MSAYNKDPIENEDTPSESSESHSDDEVNKAEENLEKLKIKEASKYDSEESKPLDSSNQGGTFTNKQDLLGKQTAGSSGLQKGHLDSSNASLDPDSKRLSSSDTQEEKDLKSNDIDEDIEAKMVEESLVTSEMESEAKCVENIKAETVEESEEKFIDENIEAVMVEKSLDSTDTELKATVEDKNIEYKILEESIVTSEMESEAKYVEDVKSEMAEKSLISSERESEAKYVEDSKAEVSEKSLDSTEMESDEKFENENIEYKILEESLVKSEMESEANVDESIEARVAEGHSDTTNSTSPFIQSSPSSMLQDKSPVPGPSRPRGEEDYMKHTLDSVVNRFMKKSSRQSSSSRRSDYANDSANTSSDISEIRTELADISTDGSLYHDAREIFEKEQSPSYVPAVERQSSETSESNISEIQDDFVPPPTPEGSSVSSASGEQGHQAYMAQLQREADARGVPISTSSGIGSTNQSELARLKAWNIAGARAGGYYRHDVDDPNLDILEQVDEEPASESGEEPILEHQQIQGFDRLFEQEQQSGENMEQRNLPEDVNEACRHKVDENVQKAIATSSPSKRRRASKCKSDSSTAEKEGIEKMRPRFKLTTGKKSKTDVCKSDPAMHSSSESPEPQSSSSNELLRNESPEIKSSSDDQELSKSERSRKSWQKSGLLRSMQHSMSSNVLAIPEEEEGRDSTLIEHDSKLMDSKESSTEKMETTPEKGSEGTAENMETSSKSSLATCDRAYVSEAEGTSREKDCDISDYERSVGKSKRGPKLSYSPPSDEILDSESKAAKGRPKKKARPDKISGKTRRTRHDIKDSVSKSVDLGGLDKSESTSTSESSDDDPFNNEKP